MEKLKWTTVQRKVADLIPCDFNPRSITEEGKEKMKKSLEEFDLVEIPVIDYDEIIIAGHQRIEALFVLDRGEEIIDVRFPNRKLTEKEFKGYMLLSNKHFGEFDFSEVEGEFSDFDLSEFKNQNFDETVISSKNKYLPGEEDDFEIPEEIKTDIVQGDLFEIGEHRLLCGDSTDSDQVAKLMNGEKADMAHNDPPYGMKKEKDGVLNDNLNYDDLLDFNREWIALQFMHLKENGSWYCWGIDEPLMDIYSDIIKPHAKEKKATFRNLITWFKNPSGLGDGQNNPRARSYGIITEKCLFVMMGVQGFANDLSNWFEGFEVFRKYYEDETKKAGLNISKICNLTNSYAGHYFSRSQYAFPTKEHHLRIQSYCQKNNISAFQKEYDEIKKEYEEIKKEWYSTRSYFNNTHDKMTEVWQFDRHKREGDEGGHATPKPIPLCERAIKSSCPDNGLVLDMFLGSGSTMVASHQLKRKCYGMELDEKYCDVIVRRMLSYDETLTIKRNGIDETEIWKQKILETA